MKEEKNFIHIIGTVTGFADRMVQGIYTMPPLTLSSRGHQQHTVGE